MAGTTEKLIKQKWLQWWEAAEKLPFEPEYGYGRFPLQKLRKAPWNYKLDDEEQQARLVAMMRQDQQILNLNIRLIEKEGWEVLDGNHRYDALKIILAEFGIEAAVCFNHGEITQADAVKKSINLNETRFDYDIFKMATAVDEVLTKMPTDMPIALAFDEEQQRQFQEVARFDWKALLDLDKAKIISEDGKERQFVEMNFLIPKDAKKLIEAELDRIIQHCGHTDKEEEVARGLALEKIVALSSQTPLESLR